MHYSTQDLARAWERGRESKPSGANPYTSPPHAEPTRAPKSSSLCEHDVYWKNCTICGTDR